jgi:hypothetical protein
MTTPLEEAVERVRKLVSCFDKFSDGHRMLGDSLLLGDLRTLLNALSIDEERVAMLSEALSDDECTICGKTRKQHHTGSGVGMCQIYPIFRSRRAAFSALVEQARQSIVGEGLA